MDTYIKSSRIYVENWVSHKYISKYRKIMQKKLAKRDESRQSESE